MASRKPANVAGINPITNYFSRLTPQQLPKGASGDDGVTSPNTSQALPVRTPGVSKSAGNKENARSDDAGLEMDTSEPAGLSPHGTRSYVDAKEKQTSEENSDVIMHDAFSTPAKFRDDNVLVSADSDEICGVDGEDAALGSQSLQSASTASIWQNVGQTVDGSMKEAECRTPEKADRALWDVDFVASSVHPERALNILSSERQHYWRAPKIHHDDVNVEYSESGRETAPGEAVPLGGIRLPPMRRDDDDSSESSDDELRDIDALLGIKG